MIDKHRLKEADLFDYTLGNNKNEGRIWISAYTRGCGCCSSSIISDWYDKLDGLKILNQIKEIYQDKIDEVDEIIKRAVNGGKE